MNTLLSDPGNHGIDHVQGQGGVNWTCRPGLDLSGSRGTSGPHEPTVPALTSWMSLPYLTYVATYGVFCGQLKKLQKAQGWFIK